MPNIVYYREGSAKAPGVCVSLAEAVNSDDGGHRARLKARVRSDEHFLRHSLRQKDIPAEQYVREYDARAQAMVKAMSTSALAPPHACLRLYEKGTVEPGQDAQAAEINVRTLDGRVRPFARDADTCPWDESHEAAILPDDVTQIHGFGEGALLNVIRRRFLEQYKIYTYVGDILIVVNPYMFMSENVAIEEPAKACVIASCFGLFGLFKSSSSLTSVLFCIVAVAPAAVVRVRWRGSCPTHVHDMMMGESPRQRRASRACVRALGTCRKRRSVTKTKKNNDEE